MGTAVCVVEILRETLLVVSVGSKPCFWKDNRCWFYLINFATIDVFDIEY